MMFIKRGERAAQAMPDPQNMKGGTKTMKRLLNLHANQRGITGLETAIILIAFVVVAAVFAYTVLSAGLFSTQKSSEAVYSGLKEAQSTLELKGAVLAEEGTANKVARVTFTLANALSGEPINFAEPDDDSGTGAPDGIADSDSTNVVVISYVDKYQRVDDLTWKVTKLADADSDNLLEAGERFQITVGDNRHSSTSNGDGDLEDALDATYYLASGREFSIEVKPPVGAVLIIERTIPTNTVMDSIMNLN